MEKLRKGNELEDSKSRERIIRIEEAKEDSERRDDSSKGKTRQGNSDREEAGRKGRTAEEVKQSEEILGLAVDDEQPEQLVLEIKDEKKKKKKTKKVSDKLKDEIKLLLVGIYGLAGTTLDKCFYLKPSEADLLTEAIYRYLDEHNLLSAVSEKTATVNLIIALIAVNVPKIMTYYKKIKQRKEDREDDKSRKIEGHSGQSASGVRRGQYDTTNAKTHLDQFYQPNAG